MLSIVLVILRLTGGKSLFSAFTQPSRLKPSQRDGTEDMTVGFKENWPLVKIA